MDGVLLPGKARGALKGDRGVVVSPLEPAGDLSLVLWGAAIDGADAQLTAEALAAVLSELGESGRRRTEPDVVIVGREFVAVIEAKYRSGNDLQHTESKFRRYVSPNPF